jgi:putative two-component system response regulator
MPQQKVLVVDDEEMIRNNLVRILQKDGLDVVTACNGQEALQVFREQQPDLVLLDILMPLMNGFEVCEHIKGDPQTRLTPVVLVTSSSATENRVRGIEAGADDFLGKPFERIELSARVRSLLRLKRYTDELERAETVLMALARSIEGKDPYTEGHCERLSEYGAKLGERLGLPEEEISALRTAGVVHDIGKVAIPDAILLKKGPLDESEMAVMKEHPVVGERICSTLRSFKLVLPIIRHHHEKLDGTGYPDGLRGEEIPRTARVLQVVDVFDALSTKRPYKPAFATAKVLAIMRDEVIKGWWDPEIFAVFEQMVREPEFVFAAETRG